MAPGDAEPGKAITLARTTNSIVIPRRRRRSRLPGRGRLSSSLKAWIPAPTSGMTMEFVVSRMTAEDRRGLLRPHHAEPLCLADGEIVRRASAARDRLGEHGVVDAVLQQILADVDRDGL